METKHIYKKMTNVDIDEQRLLWDDRGKGYYGEYLLFCELYKMVPGNCKLLMNLNIPVGNGKTTEIDLLMIHETGFYVFEVKHYKGTIYGDDKGEIWTQYFRTVKNSVFKNPILQNEYHLMALKKLFPSVSIASVIVFTNQDCILKIENNNLNIDVCNLNNLYNVINYRFSRATKFYSMEEIDKMFNILSKYSQMQDEILYDGEAKSFIEWLEPSINMIKQKHCELEINKQNLLIEKNKLRNIGIGVIIADVVVVFLCIVFSIFCIVNIKSNYDLEMEKFKHNFKHVDEIGNEYITAVNDFTTVSGILIENVNDYIVSFSATLNVNNDLYGIALTESSKYIVMTKNNKVFEYDVFGEHLPYNRYSNILGKGIRESGTLTRASFIGVSKEEISYIKITNIDLFKLNINKTIVKNNLELELYKE